MAARALHFAGNPAPTPNDIVIERQDARAKALGERLSLRDIARPIGMVVTEVMDALVVFGKRENADVECLFVLPGSPGFD
jgi:hypothetical protein